ncbi:hypothetical protein BU25DRAFT_410890 [Macroventuria anomochaeta]|uniref:Uncharacterized protein n=1 Tax=Macroventuria anomochaeta TaxID=301207 RepID=A0ACB6RZR9_9PLEO|nr:uncharacterized protein BU25DRAFT_410890 [Macroventuria anomochaeta]KAF2627273.1 hypothetical protein BU25DRAFT_410890 [Macroventuria anomochaeta]
MVHIAYSTEIDTHQLAHLSTGPTSTPSRRVEHLFKLYCAPLTVAFLPSTLFISPIAPIYPSGGDIFNSLSYEVAAYLLSITGKAWTDVVGRYYHPAYAVGSL